MLISVVSAKMEYVNVYKLTMMFSDNGNDKKFPITMEITFEYIFGY